MLISPERDRIGLESEDELSKTIVTHFNPDLDAITSTWLIKRFFSGWEEADLEFVVAGKTYRDEPVDVNPDIIHVDTGGGKFDHHQDKARKPACGQVFDGLKKTDDKFNRDEALERLTEVVSDADVGSHIHWPEGQTDRYEFSLDSMIGGLKRLRFSDQKQVDWGLVLLDAIYATLKVKVQAEKNLGEGLVFETKWGNGIAFETVNDMVLELAEKKGYSVALRKDPRSGAVRFYARNDRGVDLTPVWESLREKDPEATWFLHQSKCLLLNGSSKNPEMKATKLSLKEVVEILKSH